MTIIKVFISFIIFNFIICSFAIVVGQNHNSQSNDLLELNLFGKVKTLYFEFWNLDTLSKLKKGNLSITHFNEVGNITEDCCFSEDSSYIWHRIYSYDVNGNLQMVKIYNANSKLIATNYFKYDTFNNEIEFISNCEEGINRTVSTYNNRHENIAKIFYKSDSIVDEKITYNLDDNGLITETCFYSNHNTLKFRYTYEYNDKGNQTVEKFYDRNSGDTSYTKTTYKYDAKGHVIEGLSSSTESAWVTKYEYKFDTLGNRIEEQLFEDGVLTEKVIIKFEYDEMLNWVKQTRFTNGVVEKIIERKFDYYKK